MFRVRPDILHGYLDGNLPALFLGAAFHKQVVWGIRRTSQDLSKLNRLTRWLLKLMIWLSRFVDLVIFNSEAGRLNHRRMGMRSPRMEVVPNGFDISQFSPDLALGTAQKQAWGVPDDSPLIGMVGRLIPTKDHPTFLRAAKRLSQEWPTARFICAGGGSADYANSLYLLADSLGISDRVLWPGTCSQMPSVYNALTILVLSSTDEGFPNVVGEAMACGIPCVSTKVGDAVPLIGDTGFVTEIGDDEAIANAVSVLLRESVEARAARAQAARQRICTSCSIEALTCNTEQALLAILPDSPENHVPAAPG
jgi:glycosyltransferase involved in cell wall biosynthesis